MISRLFPTTALLALLTVPVCVFAQLADTTASEDERIEALIREQGEFYRPKSEVRIGFRMLNSGTNVKFGNLGSVAQNPVLRTLSNNSTYRQYDNGEVFQDSARTEETPGTVTSTDGKVVTTTTLMPNGRYQLSIDTTVTAEDGSTSVVNTTYDRLGYATGQTRNWSYDTAEQTTAKPGFIAMNSYSAVSEGATVENQQGKTGGVEIEYGRLVRKLGKRFELNFSAGVAVNGINNKAAGDVTSTLRTYTDYYSLNGQPVPVDSDGEGYTGPSFSNRIGADGSVELINATETTTTISDAPVLSETVDTPGGTTVRGRWQVKGAYFMMRVGPSLRAQLTERLGLSASLSLAGAYTGTRYTATEIIDIPNVDSGGTISTPVTEFTDKNKLLAGYYADVNLEWAANETTGFFGGLSAQKFGGYDQELGTRNARIDLGSSVGLRGGVSIKF